MNAVYQQYSGWFNNFTVLGIKNLSGNCASEKCSLHNREFVTCLWTCLWYEITLEEVMLSEKPEISQSFMLDVIIQHEYHCILPVGVLVLFHFIKPSGLVLCCGTSLMNVLFSWFYLCRLTKILTNWIKKPTAGITTTFWIVQFIAICAGELSSF